MSAAPPNRKLGQRLRKKLARRNEAAMLDSRAIARKNAGKHLKFDERRADYLLAVNALANHARNRWARAGYPGQASRDPLPVVRFLHPLHPLRRTMERRAS